jgi:hypothetical protein
MPRSLYPTERDKNDQKWIDMTNTEVNRTLCFKVHATHFGFIHRFLRTYTQSYSKYNFKYTTVEIKVPLDIYHTTGLITLIRTNFAIGTAIFRKTNRRIFFYGYQLARLFATYDEVSSQLQYSQETTIGIYSDPHESSLCHHIFYCSATLTEVFPCFFLSCKANARV